MKKRKPFQGVLNILSFNRHFYYFGILTLIILMSWSLWFEWPSPLIFLILGGFLYGLIMPLLVSAYVYDFSNYYQFNWLDKFVDGKNNKLTIVNINAGFDETSFSIKAKFPKSNINVFDFYDVNRHTEPAIKRARKVSHVFPDTQSIDARHIPMLHNSSDIVFLLSAAHEIRSNSEKIEFLKEVHRICKSKGIVIMVEHLRDLPNFLAFTIGVTHFFSRSTWLSAFHSADFASIKESKFTPFMSVFVCKP